MAEIGTKSAKARRRRQKATENIQEIEKEDRDGNISAWFNCLHEKLKMSYRVGDLDLPQRYASSRVEEDVGAHDCPYGSRRVLISQEAIGSKVA